MNWIFSERNKLIAQKQVTGSENFLSDKYELVSRSEYRAYRLELDIVPGMVVADLACGLGRVAVYIANVFRRLGVDMPHFILTDSDTEQDGKLHYGYSGQAEFYNSFAATREFMFNNGVPESKFELFDVLKRDYAEIAGKPDVIISMLGLGFHIPISRCIEQIHSICKESTVVILGGPCMEDDADWFDKNSYPHLFKSQKCIPFTCDHRSHEGQVMVLRGAK